MPKHVTELLDSFSQEVWSKTYKDHKDENINDTLYRVAKALASVEETEDLQNEWTEKFYDLLSNFKATVGGRIYANAGTEWKGTTLINCYVAPRPNHDYDSIDGIYKVLVDQAKTLKSEGGWGQNFSWMRPRGSFIEGIGVETPGAVKFMEIFDKSSEIVTSGSGKEATDKRAKGKIRKGAMMAVMDVTHPDIIEFITAKQTPGRLSKFNMSVNCTDEFMSRILKIQEIEKVIAAELAFDMPNTEQLNIWTAERAALDKWDLIFPVTSHPKYKKEWTGSVKEWVEKGYPTVVHNTVSALWLWNLIMESTYNRAEPGVLFLDRANEINELNYLETIYSTNPCVTGDTIVSTDVGNITMFELVNRFKAGEAVQALSYDECSGNTEFQNITFGDMTRKNAEIISLELENGKILKLTPDHKVFTENRGYIEASKLTEDDILIYVE